MNAVYENKISPISCSVQSQLSKLIHLHKELEIIHVKRGQVIAYADQKRYLLNVGDTFIAFPHQIHYYHNLQNGEYRVIIFHSDIIHSPGVELYHSIPDCNYIPAGDKELDYFLDKLMEVWNHTNETATAGYLNLIMSRILPKLKLKTSVFDCNSPLFKIVNYCNRNFQDNISLDTMAKELHLSKYHISRLINRGLSQNFNQYVNSLRVSEACSQLRETEKKIVDIAEDVGFGTSRSFNRAFKDILGMTPAEYRSNACVFNTLPIRHE